MCKCPVSAHWANYLVSSKIWGANCATRATHDAQFTPSLSGRYKIIVSKPFINVLVGFLAATHISLDWINHCGCLSGLSSLSISINWFNHLRYSTIKGAGAHLTSTHLQSSWRHRPVSVWVSEAAQCIGVYEMLHGCHGKQSPIYSIFGKSMTVTYRWLSARLQ